MQLRRFLFVFVVPALAACDGILSPPRPRQRASSDSLPPLESISYDLLGHSKIVFERLSTLEVEADGLTPLGGIYVIDAAAKRSYPLVDYRKFDGAAPAISPDGKSVAFTAYSTDFPCCGRQLYVVDIDGTNLRRIGSHADGETFSPSWWPGGNEVLARVSDDRITSFYRQAPTPTASPTLVARFQPGADSSWSFAGQVTIANNRMLMSAARRAQSPPTVAWRGFASMNEDGTGLTRFHDAPSVEWPIYAPTYSPDGRRIAFLEGSFNSFNEWMTTVEVMNADGSDEQALTSVGTVGTDGEGNVGSPNAFSLCWLSSGNIVFSAPMAEGLWHLFVVSTTPPADVHMLTTDLGAQDTSVSCTD